MLAAPETCTTIAHYLQFRAQRQPSDIAFRWLAAGDQVETVTWSELYGRASACAAAIRERVAPRSHVVLCLPQGLDFIAAIFGCFFADCTAVPVYPPDSAKTLPRFKNIVEDSNACLVITSDAIAGRIERLSVDAPVALPLLLMEEIAPGAGAADIVLPRPEQLALLQYTSGTTSAPKGVMIGHDHLLHNEYAAAQAYRVGDTPHLVSWLPFYHDMGLMGGVLFPVYKGIAATLMSPATFLRNPAQWLRVMSETRATISGGPNFAFEMCATRIADDVIDNLDLSNWQTAVCGAEMIRPQTVTKFIQRFSRAGFRPQAFTASYGLAEATLYVTSSDHQQPLFDSPRDNDTQFTSCGKTRVGCIEIVDPYSGQRCDPGELGEIWIRTPSVGAGYWNRERESQEIFNVILSGASSDASPDTLPHGVNADPVESDAGFLRSGDLGFTRDGNLFVTGRLKELIILRGKNYSPQDIEIAAAQSNPAFSGMQCAAFAVDTDTGDKLVVVQEVSRRLLDGQPTAHLQADIRLALRAALAVDADDIVLVRQNSLPRTSSGKLQRTQVKALYGNDALERLADNPADRQPNRQNSDGISV